MLEQVHASQYARSLIEASLDPLVTISIEGKITDLNEASSRITGVSRAKLIGSDFFDYFTEPQKAREVYQEVFAKGSVADSPLTLRDVNGKLTDVLFNGSIYKDDTGKVLGVVIVARDVTAQKLLSRYSLSLIEASRDPLVTISIDGKITDMNEATVNITGMSRIQLRGTDFFDYFTEPEKARDGYRGVFENGSVTDYPLTLRHLNGKLTDVLFNASTYKNDAGEVLGVVAVARDVTAQKLLSRYSLSLIEASRDPLVTISIDGKVTDMNEATVNITGMSRVQLTGTDFFDYFTEPEKAREVYRTVFEKGSVTDSPLTLRHTNGKLTDVLFNGSTYKNDAGDVLGVVVVARDVTEKKIIEANLEKTLKEVSGYKMALDESSIVAITDHRGIITFANDNFCNISKYSREELIGQDHRIVNSGFHEHAFIQNLWETIQSGKIWRGEIKNKAKDGTTYWVDSTIVPFANEQGEIYQYVAIRSDITAKKLLSQYSLSLIEASRDPLVTISPEGKIMDMNQATIDVTEKTREQLTGTDFKDYFTDSVKAHEVYGEVFKKGFVKDYPLTMKDGKLTDVLFNGSVYKDDRGNVLGAVIVARDIMEQKRNEKELTEAKVMAELAAALAEEAKLKAENATLIAVDAVKAKQQFLSNMSHEIRTPMNAILGFTKVILKTDLSPKQMEYMTAIKMSGDSLIVLINDILDLAKVDAGKMTFEKTPFKMAMSISAMLHLFEPKIQEKNLQLIKIYDDQIPTTLVGDPVRLHQIILNLVSNAVKFTNEGAITVGVKMLSSTSENVNIEFSVADTGIGIPPNRIDHIFENFQQAYSGTSRLYGGTGLGLAIVKQLVEPQGGSIKVTSQVGVGSTFSFQLSFRKTTAEIEPEQDVVKWNPETTKLKILVVEDIALNQLLMRTLLDDFGFECDIAANGKIAIEKLQQQSISETIKPYDLILMDLQMPEMNGFEATSYIRNIMKLSIPIVALTADVTTVDVTKCKAVGMNDYIAKPVNDKLLYNKIVGLVKQSPTIPASDVKVIEPDTTTKRYTDISYLMHRTKSNPKLMMEMISLYLEQTPRLVQAMRESMNNKDWKTLAAAVHKMIPSFTIMGVNPDYELMAKNIQLFANSQQETDEVSRLVEQLEHGCAMACKELEIEFHRIKKEHEERG